MSFCKECGTPLKPGAKFCEGCGAPTGDQPTPPSQQPSSIQEIPAAPSAPKKGLPFSHPYLIAGIVIVVIILFGLIASGILSIGMTVTVKDPIEGVWRTIDSSGVDVRVRFDGNGTVTGSGYNPDTKETAVQKGVWNSLGNNSYRIRWTDGSTFTVIRVPAKNAIYDPDYPNQLYTAYQGDVMAAPTRPEP